MTLSELLSHLYKLNVKVRADNGQLILTGPKGALTPALRAELTERKAEILTFLINEASAARPKEPPRKRWLRNGNLPLSYTQQRLWFLDQLEPQSAVYNMACAFRLEGELHVVALERSVNEILRRHESLRTVFPSINGEPVQKILSFVARTLSVVDLSAWQDNERDTEARRIAGEEAKKPFDLAEGPLMRAQLLRLRLGDHIFLIIMHHIASDGWSMGVLFREMSDLYKAFSKDQPSPLAELPLQYADYTLWQRTWLQGDNLERQRTYWKQQLKDIPPLLELPADRPRPKVQTHRGAKHSIILPEGLVGRLKVLSRREGATLFMTLLAAFQTLLHRYTGHDDIVVGSPIAGRTRVEMEGLIGFFVNTLILRTDFSGNPSFCDLLKRVREVSLGAFANPDVPFETMMGELTLERTLSRNTLFQVLFVLQNTPSAKLDLEGLSVTAQNIDDETAKFDLSLYLVPKGEQLSAGLEYSTDLFDEGTIKRMLSHFQTLLQGIVADVDRRIKDLPILTEAENHQLLLEWNDTKSDYTQNQCVHELFEQQVERNPEADAVVFEDQRLTYRELNRRANQLAHHLQKQGLGPETLVAMCMERSIDMLVGLLGVLKIGAAYVPLDPNYPDGRLVALLADIQAPLLLTQRHLLPRFCGQAAKSIVLDSQLETIALEPEHNPSSKVDPDGLAYVIYTSGSSGESKGVEITHRALANFANSACAAFELKSSDRVLQFASLSFDTAIEEIVPCLIRGATLALRTDSMLDSVSLFLQKCRDWQITVLDLPTVYWHELTEQLSSEQLIIPGQLRLVIIGGERARPERLAQWQKHVGERVRLLNTYGPTETTVVATMCDVTTSPHAEALMREVPIGRPILNVQTYILDSYLNPVPIGVTGEMHIGGVGLARGYLRRPELTAENFIANPFSKEPGARLYKTGDLARYRPDGDIEFIGRSDYQVKIRGFRIEPGEIEFVLSQHPAIKETAIVAREDITENHETDQSQPSKIENLKSQKRLVAYVVPHNKQACAASELRNFLKQKLPDYMVPSLFIFLDTLPITSNGKVDRKSLPVPGHNRPELGEGYVAPRTPVEAMLSKIWAEVLKLDKVGIKDNFFDLGGHSLLATQVVSRIRNALQGDLPLRVLFEEPTVAGLSDYIEAVRWAGKGSSQTPGNNLGATEEIPI